MRLFIFLLLYLSYFTTITESKQCTAQTSFRVASGGTTDRDYDHRSYTALKDQAYYGLTDLSMGNTDWSVSVWLRLNWNFVSKAPDEGCAANGPDCTIGQQGAHFQVSNHVLTMGGSFNGLNILQSVTDRDIGPGTNDPRPVDPDYDYIHVRLNDYLNEFTPRIAIAKGSLNDIWFLLTVNFNKTIDGGGYFGTVSFYINGSPVTSNVVTHIKGGAMKVTGSGPGQMPVCSSYVCFGCACPPDACWVAPWWSSACMDGYIDDPRAYYYQLTDSQVMQGYLYNVWPTPQMYYTFNESSGVTMYDSMNPSNVLTKTSEPTPAIASSFSNNTRFGDSVCACDANYFFIANSTECVTNSTCTSMSPNAFINSTSLTCSCNNSVTPSLSNYNTYGDLCYESSVCNSTTILVDDTISTCVSNTTCFTMDTYAVATNTTCTCSSPYVANYTLFATTGHLCHCPYSYLELSCGNCKAQVGVISAFNTSMIPPYYGRRLSYSGSYRSICNSGTPSSFLLSRFPTRDYCIPNPMYDWTLLNFTMQYGCIAHNTTHLLTAQAIAPGLNTVLVNQSTNFNSIDDGISVRIYNYTTDGGRNGQFICFGLSFLPYQLNGVLNITDLQCHAVPFQFDAPYTPLESDYGSATCGDNCGAPGNGTYCDLAVDSQPVCLCEYGWAMWPGTSTCVPGCNNGNKGQQCDQGNLLYTNLATFASTNGTILACVNGAELTTFPEYNITICDCSAGRYGANCTSCGTSPYGPVASCFSGSSGNGTWYCPHPYVLNNQSLCDCPPNHLGPYCNVTCASCNTVTSYCNAGINSTNYANNTVSCHCYGGFMRNVSAMDCGCPEGYYGYNLTVARLNCSLSCPSCHATQTCYDDWFGDGQCYCNDFYVNGTQSQRGTVNGVQPYNLTCQCASGFYGSMCSVCPMYSMNDTHAMCNDGIAGNGTTYCPANYELTTSHYGTNDTTQYCDCTPNRWGHNCTACNCTDVLHVCSQGERYGTGSCTCTGSGVISSIGQPNCSCVAGKYGAYCNQTCNCPSFATCLDGKSGNGTCICNAYSTWNGTTCACNTGYTGTNCTQAIPCQPGKYHLVLNEPACGNCSAGRFNDATGATTCSLCPPGYYNNRNSSSSCNLCGIGSFANSTGQTACHNCTNPLYQDLMGATQCYNCSLLGGAFVNSSFCLVCDAPCIANGTVCSCPAVSSSSYTASSLSSSSSTGSALQTTTTTESDNEFALYIISILIPITCTLLFAYVLYVIRLDRSLRNRFSL
jgi:hypothetical protein